MVAQRTKLIVLFATLVIDVMGIGIILPVIPLLVQEMTGGEVGSAATIYGLLVALYSLMQFLFGPLIGALSDRFGRRPILLISLIGLGFDYILLALAPNLWIIALARIIGGIMGASLTTASAYVADISPPERRAEYFGYLGAAFGVGFIIGPLMGGVLAEFGSRVPFFAAAGVSLIVFVFAWFALPESLPQDRRRPVRLKEANPIGAFMVIGRYPVVLALFSVFAVTQLAERMLESNWVLFTNFRFGWGPQQVGFSLALVGALFVVAQGGLVRVVVPRLGERRTLTFGLIVGGLCLLALGFADRSWMIFALIVPYVLAWGMTGPAIQSMVTREVSPTEQGILQGSLTSVATASGIVGPPVAGALFGFFIGDLAPVFLPGIAFIVGAVLFAVGLGLHWRRSRAERASRAKPPDP
ncbi:MAG: TCR/Tet family MFS transporter [Alphaproteobacteria bacterium]